MVSMDAQHAGEPGFDSLLRHFFKNLTQHLALPVPPGGVTVRRGVVKQWVEKTIMNRYFSTFGASAILCSGEDKNPVW